MRKDEFEALRKSDQAAAGKLLAAAREAATHVRTLRVVDPQRAAQARIANADLIELEREVGNETPAKPTSGPIPWDQLNGMSTKDLAEEYYVRLREKNPVRAAEYRLQNAHLFYGAEEDSNAS